MLILTDHVELVKVLQQSFFDRGGTTVLKVDLNQFSKFCTAGKHMKCATKPICYYPPHLRNVAINL